MVRSSNGGAHRWGEYRYKSRVTQLNDIAHSDKIKFTIWRSPLLPVLFKGTTHFKYA